MEEESLLISPEICDNGLDDNDNGEVDCHERSCRLTEFYCQEPSSCSNPLVLLANDIPRKGSTVDKGNTFSPACQGNGRNEAPDEVFRIDIEESGTYCIETLGSEFDTVLYKLESCRLSRVRTTECNDDSGRGNSARIEFESGIESHFFVVDGYGDKEGIFYVNVRRGTCEETICDDGIDNDRDGEIDCEESSCFNLASCVETCNDGVDNNNDGRVDCDDPTCGGTPFCQEDCEDGMDNDADGLIDCQDPACIRRPICMEVCDDGVDNNGNGRVDCQDFFCAESELCNEICDDGVDNNGSGRIDCQDPFCARRPVCTQQVCEEPQTLVVPGVAVGTLGSDNLIEGQCGGRGREKMLRVVAPEEGQVCMTTVTQRDMVLYTRAQCDLPASEFSCNDDGGNGTEARIVLDMDAGQEIFVIVDEFSLNPERDDGFRLLALYGDCFERDCANGVDDDIDGLVDCKDPDCRGTTMCQEICDDGLDNDINGLADCMDAACRQEPACAEVCDDGVDNNNDGRVDCQDRDCAMAPGCFEICNDGVDNNDDSRVDCEDPTCGGTPFCQEDCEDGVDNDADGLIDCQDPACIRQPVCAEICDDGIDNNNDGRVDCEDSFCVNEEACSREAVCANAQAWPGAGVHEGVLSLFGREASFCGGVGKEAIYNIQPTQDTTWCVTVRGALMDPVLYVRTLCAEPTTEVVCNDDFERTRAAQIELAVSAGQAYFLFVDTYQNEVERAYTLEVEEGLCP